MYDPMSRSYTLKDLSDSYDWIVDNVRHADVARMSDEELFGWIDDLIASVKEADLERAIADVEGFDYPLHDPVTGVVYRDSNECLAAARTALERDYASERATVARWLRDWVQRAEPVYDGRPLTDVLAEHSLTVSANYKSAEVWRTHGGGYTLYITEAPHNEEAHGQQMQFGDTAELALYMSDVAHLNKWAIKPGA